jgi:prepilin-type N-terminal cleavage/methylation domain-containing protein
MTSTRLLLARTLMAKLAKRKSKGFTLIELLVVVVIIGILASVALPSFVGAQDKARNASVQANARTVQMALEEFSTENNGAYPPTEDWVAAKFTTGGSYLPGATMPKSPWQPSTGVTPQVKAIAATGGEGAVLASADATVAVGKPGKMMQVNTEIAAAGKIPSTWAKADEYGAISYDYEANTQYYVLYATGKKGKTAIGVASVSNAGN